jgi:adenosylcobinamide-phosphate synthase
MLVEPLALVTLALLVEAAIGYPGRVYTAIGHPVTWIGALIAALDRDLNREDASPAARRMAGVLALVAILAVPGVLALAIQVVLSGLGLVGLLVAAILASSLLAQRSLFEHVAAVRDGLRADGLAGGRKAVSMIVGRNPHSLDEAGVSRAAIESLAENFSDGIVAPAFWIGLGGLPGGVLYKAANTADSMIGHRTPRHQAFGWAAARFDDVINLPASRLTALLLIAAAALQPQASARRAWAAVRRDAGKHRSPNAGWPEAAMAGALGLRLAGPRTYGDTVVADSWMGDGRAEANADDIDRALSLYRSACALLIGLAALLAITALALSR